MEQKFCKECGAEISVHYITAEKIYRITEDGKFERDDNNDAFCPGGGFPYVDFRCSEDLEHDIGEDDELEPWMDAVEIELVNSGILLE